MDPISSRLARQRIDQAIDELIDAEKILDRVLALTDGDRRNRLAILGLMIRRIRRDLQRELLSGPPPAA